MKHVLPTLRTASLLAISCLLAGKESPAGPTGAAGPAAAKPSAAPRVAESSSVNQVQRTTFAAATDADCQSEQWFNLTPREFVPGCVEMPMLPLSMADVNSDGRMESFVPSVGSPDGFFLTNFDYFAPSIPPVAVPWPDVIVLNRITTTPSGPKVIQTSLCSFDESLSQSFINQLPDVGQPCQYYWAVMGMVLGWADCDGDQDLDLVVRISVAKRLTWNFEFCDFGAMGYWSVVSSKLLWFENTGFEAAPPTNPYDLDHDGEVGASDISRLLLEFTN